MTHLISLFMFLESLFAPLPVCNPNNYGGSGTWIVEGETCWYLHSTPEFDASPTECQACHDGIQAGEW